MFKRLKKASKDNGGSSSKDFDSLIKNALIGHLGEAVRELQRQQAAAQYQTEAAAVVESSSEPAHTLCCVLEALFVHKLRDSLVERVSSVFTGDVVRQPAPNFWPFLLSFSHRNTTEYLLANCSWLRTDIGRCRGWIRTVLNDGMLSSYLDLLAGEKRLVNDFYDRESLLRDAERLDIARKLLSGVEQLEFRLAVNSSMLNSWSATPLLLAGLWAPPTPVIHEAVVQGVDAALCFTDEDDGTLQAVQKKEASNLPPPPAPTVDQDLAFRLIVESDRCSMPPIALLPAMETQQQQQQPQQQQHWTIPQANPTPPHSLPGSLRRTEQPQWTAHATQSLSAEGRDESQIEVTRLRPKGSRAPSPATLKPQPHSEQQADAPAAAAPAAIDEAVAVARAEDARLLLLDSLHDDDDDDRETDSSLTFEDLLENYTSLTIGGLKSSRAPDSLVDLVSVSATTNCLRPDSLEDGAQGFELIEGFLSSLFFVSFHLLIMIICYCSVQVETTINRLICKSWRRSTTRLACGSRNSAAWTARGPWD